MITLSTRREASLREKFAALNTEFQEWLDLTEESKDFEKHHTQLRALTGHLKGLRSQTEAAFNTASKSGILAQARNLESLLLGIRRIWEFFRSKLVQRRDPEMRKFLQLADELAWACYKPVLDVSGATARREPPLVFLNGGLSPYALSREEAFFAEDVPGETLSGRTYDQVLKHLPIPVIGVPWYQASHLPDLPVVAHETGHTVESDFGLQDAVKLTIASRLSEEGRPERSDHWKAWSHEVFADLWGCLTLGPAFVGSLMDFLALGRNVVENETATEEGKYPTAHLRMLLCFEALEKLDFKADSIAARNLWEAEYKKIAMPESFEKDVPAVFHAVLLSKYIVGGVGRVLSEIPGLCFKPVHWSYAKSAVQELTNDKIPESATTAPTLVAAARFLFEKDPGQYKGYSLVERISSIVRPGTRAGENLLSDEEKDNLSIDSYQSGIAWFDDFTKWADGFSER
jgi:hypothetical protein